MLTGVPPHPREHKSDLWTNGVMPTIGCVVKWDVPEYELFAALVIYIFSLFK